MQNSARRRIAVYLSAEVLLLILWILPGMLYGKLGVGFFEGLSVTGLTCFYHFSMRWILGETVPALCRERILHSKSGIFRIHPFEAKIYKALRVKQWKAKVLTEQPEKFDLHCVGPAELLQNMMQSELTHGMAALLSFAPLLLILKYGKPLVFAVTSVLACAADLQFVAIQRFNRPRVEKIQDRRKK